MGARALFVSATVFPIAAAAGGSLINQGGTLPREAYRPIVGAPIRVCCLSLPFVSVPSFAIGLYQQWLQFLPL